MVSAVAFAQAQKLDGQLWSLLLLRASALEDADRWPEAKAALQQALALAPDQPLLLNFLGYAKLERGEDMDAAEAMIRKASELAPDEASITDSLGWAQFKRGKVDEAIATLQRAAEKDPTRRRSRSISATRSTVRAGATRRASPGTRRWSRPRTRSPARVKAKLAQRSDAGQRRALSAPSARDRAGEAQSRASRPRQAARRAARDRDGVRLLHGWRSAERDAGGATFPASDGPVRRRAWRAEGQSRASKPRARSRQAAGVDEGAALTLDKKLPVASGIGGGSADAAAALRLLTSLWQIDPEHAQDVAPTLGSDVPACLLSLPMRGEGAGDQLTPIDLSDVSGTPVLLVNPRVPLSTAEVFARWDGEDRGPLGDWREGRNDLEAPAIALVPQIEAVLAWLGTRPGATLRPHVGLRRDLFRFVRERGRARCGASAVPREWWRLATFLR